MNRGSSIAALLRQLSEHWDADLALEWLDAWKSRFQASADVIECRDGAIFFVASLRSIRLRGADEMPCILLAGDFAQVASRLQDFRDHLVGESRLALVFAVSERAAREAETCLSGSRCAVFGPGLIVSSFSDPASLEILRTAIRRSAPIRSLNPYNILLSPQSNMFFGRTAELEKLRDDDETSFAIAGPSRIGKTSLVHQYRRNLREASPERYRGTFYVDLMECPRKAPSALAHFLAMRLEGTRFSAKVGLEEFPNLLRRMRYKLGLRVELILDEVDSVAEGALFQVLGDAAKQNLCRLILCGRGILLKTVLSGQRVYGCRLELMRLEPLDDASASTLVLDPLRDLGFEFRDPSQIVAHLSRMTGKLPHLLQFCLRRLVDLSMADGKLLLTPEHVQTLRWDFETAQYFTSPLSDLMDVESRLIALSLLRNPPDLITYSVIHQIAAAESLRLDLQRCRDICNDLFINNVLAWSRGSFRIANDALVHFVAQNGDLEEAISEARDCIQPATRAGVAS